MVRTAVQKLINYRRLNKQERHEKEIIITCVEDTAIHTTKRAMQESFKGKRLHTPGATNVIVHTQINKKCVEKGTYSKDSAKKKETSNRNETAQFSLEWQEKESASCSLKSVHAPAIFFLVNSSIGTSKAVSTHYKGDHGL